MALTYQKKIQRAVNASPSRETYLQHAVFLIPFEISYSNLPANKNILECDTVGSYYNLIQTINSEATRKIRNASKRKKKEQDKNNNNNNEGPNRNIIANKSPRKIIHT